MKVMDHAQYPLDLRQRTDAELLFMARDANEAALAYPENPSVGYYLDEVHYCCAELRRRRGS